ncbi:hypothetical protein, partial [Thermosipho africanus]|uniref:hypothetical protein n=1 Tax=Thermosipho africanus TaxID=2421 RepID=UPI000570DE49
MRVLFIANPESIYVKKLLENLERYGLDYGVYCCGNFFKKGFQYKILSEGSMPNNKILKFL